MYGSFVINYERQCDHMRVSCMNVGGPGASTYGMRKNRNKKYSLSGKAAASAAAKAAATIHPGMPDAQIRAVDKFAVSAHPSLSSNRAIATRPCSEHRSG